MSLSKCHYCQLQKKVLFSGKKPVCEDCLQNEPDERFRRWATRIIKRHPVFCKEKNIEQMEVLEIDEIISRINLELEVCGKSLTKLQQEIQGMLGELSSS